MATQKKKTTKTARKPVAKTTHRKSTSRTSCKKGVTPREKWHVYIVTSLSIIAAILLGVNTAIMMVS